ncbi:MAG: hypothetical protein WBE72_15765 [Terracidiphilus sp.]
MNKAEPPSLATWILEHLTPGDRDEALAGDLLEGFRAGRSSGWYWRQAIAACAARWLESLRGRKLLVMFAVIWSMPAPVWITLQHRMESGSSVQGAMWRMDGAFNNGFSSFVVWLVLNLSFIWVGMLLYLASHTSLTRSFSREKILGAFLAAVPVFLIAYIGTFIVVNLLAWPGPVVDRRTMHPLGEFADLRMWADVLRVPFFLTMLWALWGTTARRAEPPDSRALRAQSDAQIPAGEIALAADPALFVEKRFLGFLVAVGLMNTWIAALLLGRLPDSTAPTSTGLLVRAAIYVILAAAAGVAGSRFYWNLPSGPDTSNFPIPFRLFALATAGSWAWAPSAVLLSRQDSPATAIIAGMGAAVLAAGLRSSVPLAGVSESSQAELFAETLRTPPAEGAGLVIALAIYATGYFLWGRWYLNAGAPLALAAFLFTWKWMLAPGPDFDERRKNSRATARLTWNVAAAILVTFWALMFGVGHRNRMLTAEASAAGASGSASSQKREAGSQPGISGYESIILWPVPEKKQIIPPIPEDNLLAKGARQPLVIRFDGAYWYFQPPDKRPGPLALQTHGTPLAASIRSNNSFPLFMDAHQNLGAPIRLAACREIQVAVESRNLSPGPVAMALLLTDSASPGNGTLYLGQQTIRSSVEGPGPAISPLSSELLRFFIPARANIRKFDQMTVMFFPETGYFQTAPQIVIDQFNLIPR